ncbi:MAG: fumarylacetoacetase [Pseudomonadota bacterium]
MELRRSWVESANRPGAPFPLNNLPYGVFSTVQAQPRLGVAIGEAVLDVAAVSHTLDLPGDADLLRDPRGWNGVMEAGQAVWAALRQRLAEVLSEGATERATVEPHLVPLSDATLHMPFTVAEFTDFYSGKHHAANVGTMFRGPENALPPNWLHMPMGYNGRASSVVVSGTEIRRPWGQVKRPEDSEPHFAPSARFDFEMELGAVVGQPSAGPLSVDRADASIFGFVLLNDWSARDIQAWEYQPLGPFQAKATATSISPWIVTTAALAPFRCSTPARDLPLLPHLRDTGPMNYTIDLTATLTPAGGSAETIARTNARELYFSAAQQLAHHSSCGCPMRVGDLLGSGTISGPMREARGSLLELSWGGEDPVHLSNGQSRAFIEDGDTITLGGHATRDAVTIGFGECTGCVLPALDDPYQ